MKKFVLAIFAISLAFIIPAISNKAEAQITRQQSITAADDTLVNTDTANVALTFDGSWKSVEAWVKEVSGTTGGMVYFMGEFLHGTDFAKLDSLTLTDVTTAQYKLFTVPNPRLYKSFKLQYIHAGTGVMEIKAFYVRYTGGAIQISNPYQGLAFRAGNTVPDLIMPSFSLNRINGFYIDKNLISKRLQHSAKKRAAA
jgi:hypothetical protein